MFELAIACLDETKANVTKYRVLSDQNERPPPPRKNLKEFDKDFSKVIKQDLTAIQLKSWLILFIDRLKLEGLTIEEAEEIGEAIKSALINQAKLPDRDTFMKKDK